MSDASLSSLPSPIWSGAITKLQAGLPLLWSRASRLAWVIIVACAVLLAVLCITLGFDYAPVAMLANIAFQMMIAVFLAGAGWPRAALLLESFALAFATVLVVAPLMSILASMALPLQDSVLAGIDRWMGIDWVALAHWYRAHPELMHILVIAYASINWQPALLIFLLAFVDPERLRKMMVASAITLAVTAIVFMLIPAYGPYHYFNLARADFPDVVNVAPWTVPELLENLRNGSREITSEGLVTFPSYHAATSVLFAFGWIGVPVIGVPCIILNLIMLVSTVPIGSHYIIDVIAGIVIALTSLRLAKTYFAASDRLPRFETWDRTPEGRSILAVVGGWPILGALLRQPLNASPEEQAAAT